MPTRPTKTGPQSGRIKVGSKAEAEALVKKATTKRPSKLKKPKTTAADASKPDPERQALLDKIDPSRKPKHTITHNIPGLQIKYTKDDVKNLVHGTSNRN